MISADEFWPILDGLGEDEVRTRLAEGRFGQYKIPLVKEWIARKERDRENEASRQGDVHANDALKLSAEANSIARETATSSKRAAWIAIVISLIALFVAVIDAWT